MVYERLMHGRMKYILPVVLMVMMMSGGYLFARAAYLPAVLLSMAGLLAAVMILQLYEGTNKAAAYLFDAWRNNDTTLQFPTGIHNKSLARMYNSLNMLNRHFQAIRVEHEYHEKYYRALIQHSATGLLVLDSNNRIEIMNKTACRYAGISVDSTQPDLLRIKNPLFYEAICNLNPGEDTMYRQSHGNDLQILSFRAALLRKNGNSQKLVSIQDIRYELESKELDSYRKLISVLTHEIMNLMSPLTSVSKVMVGLYHPKEKTISLADLDENILKTTLNSLQVIDEQTRGILNFLENYRKISRIPKPEIHPFPVEEWVEQLRIVYSENMARQGIAFDIAHDSQLKTILADKRLLNQVIINLLNNATEAVSENSGEKKIHIGITTAPPHQVHIQVTNNGPSITPEVQEKMFVPFYTTKKNGSGIGLSICQEIIKLHKGSLSVASVKEGHTAFIVEV